MSLSNDPVNAVHKAFGGTWAGRSKIAIGIDIGTTQSGVAFAYLLEGAEQSVHRVTQWPGQEAQNQHGKIPTIVWYDSDKQAVSFGAEALSSKAEEDAEDHGWQLAKHFKLHLHPSDLKAKHGLTLDPLPAGVPLIQIYSDFLRYLLKHTQQFFEDHILDGKNIWETYRPSMDVIIAHPNGWGIREQTFLRSAAVTAGFASMEKSTETVHFVTEAEASVHFCMYYTNLGSRLNPGVSFAVCDAGGSTVDTTVYSVKSSRPTLQLEEKCASACVQAGAIFIDIAAKNYLRQALQAAGLSSGDVDEYVHRGIKDFEGNAKRAFREEMSDQSVEIAGTRFNNTTIRARRGRMTLAGSTVKLFFDHCVKEIITSVNSQIASAGVSYILLVGGFGESPYLREQLKARFGSVGCQVATTNEATSKAVADGALIWHCVSSVVSRAPRSSYGIEIMIPMTNAKEHRGRPQVKWPSATFVKGAWSQIVTKGIAIDCDTISRRSYSREYFTPNPELTTMSEDLYCYMFGGTPKWIKNKPGNLMSGFQKVCVVTASLNNLRNALKRNTTRNGVPYWSLNFNVCIRFGRTELEAFLEWTEGSTTRTGPANIIPSSELI
ncbi:hypothetical protein BDV93DRAFT_468343 [Ceratobasidium sp. AG-I]|nr:hypothetical protein BDV93DRAFT_468343 [Ceratobasidium sp. AG-I]